MVKCRNFSNYILVIGCSEFGNTVGYIKTQEFQCYIYKFVSYTVVWEKFAVKNFHLYPILLGQKSST